MRESRGTNRRTCLATAVRRARSVLVFGALLPPVLLLAKETTFLIPQEVVAGQAEYYWDILQSNEWWSAGLPETGDSIVFAKQPKAPNVYLSRDLSVSNVTLQTAGFNLKGPGCILFETAPVGSIAGNASFYFWNDFYASVPVVWSAGVNANLNATARFAESLTIDTSTYEVNANVAVLETADLKGYWSYPNERSGSVMSVKYGKVAVTNASDFAGQFMMYYLGSLSYFGGTEPLATNTAPAELVTSGLIAQFDASDVSTLAFTNGNRICAWRSKVGDLVAEPLVTGVFPWYAANALGTNGIVDFGPSTTELLAWEQKASAAMKFSASITTAKTAFYVLDTRMGGGTLLPTMDKVNNEVKHNFRRGCPTSQTQRGLVRSGAWAVENGDNPEVLFRSNGSVCDITARAPSGTYELLTLANPTVFAHSLDGLAFDYATYQSYGSGH